MECHKLLLPLLLTTLLCLSVQGGDYQRCVFGVNSYFPHPTDCSKFFQCSNGNAVLKDCGPGTVFNPKINNCVGIGSHWDTCTKKAPPPPSPLVTCKHGDTYLAHPKDCSKFFQCSHGNAVLKDCRPGTVFNPTINNCVGKGSHWDTCTKQTPPPPPLVTCKPGDTYLAHPKDCSKFFQCSHGEPREFDCPARTIFSTKLNVCVDRYSIEVQCSRPECFPGQPTPKECKPRHICDDSDEQFIPHPKSCERYYDCKDTSPRLETSPFGEYEKECPHPQVFDIVKKQCVHYKGATCGNGRVEAKWFCNYLANRYCPKASCIPCSIGHPSCLGRKDGVWPHPQKPWSPYFTTCMDERSVNGEERCSQDKFINAAQLFDPEMRKCVPLWEVEKENGGFKPSCVDKKPDTYYIKELINIAYTCPDEKKYYCAPPYPIFQNLNSCQPMDE